MPPWASLKLSNFTLSCVNIKKIHYIINDADPTYTVSFHRILIFLTSLVHLEHLDIVIRSLRPLLDNETEDFTALDRPDSVSPLKVLSLATWIDISDFELTQSQHRRVETCLSRIVQKSMQTVEMFALAFYNPNWSDDIHIGIGVYPQSPPESGFLWDMPRLRVLHPDHYCGRPDWTTFNKESLGNVEELHVDFALGDDAESATSVCIIPPRYPWRNG